MQGLFVHERGTRVVVFVERCLLRLGCRYRDRRWLCDLLAVCRHAHLRRNREGGRHGERNRGTAGHGQVVHRGCIVVWWRMGHGRQVGGGNFSERSHNRRVGHDRGS